MWSLALSADGQLLASGGEDGTVRLWDVPSGRPLATLRGHTSAVAGVALSADGKLVAGGGGDGTVQLWDATTGRPLATIVEAEARIPESVRAELIERGHDVRALEGWTWRVGGAHGIGIDPTSGMLNGAADPRRDGQAVAF